MHPLSRRAVLGAGAGWLAGCAGRPKPAVTLPASPLRRLAPVEVLRSRVIRSIAGLRPYRPEGFVVRAESVGPQVVVHNYGHGGAGITLSWGTAEMAVELAWATGERRFAVLGCGVCGLSTARLLQARGATVTIYTKDIPPGTTSNVAGGLWSPVTLFEQTKAPPEFREQFVRACRASHRRFQLLVGDWYGVRWLPVYYLGTGGSRRQGIEDLFPDTRELTPEENPFPVQARVLRTMLIEPSTYLSRLLHEFQSAGGRLVLQEFRDVSELRALEEPVVINCTGLGSREMFGDTSLLPVKGQLIFLLPQPEVDYCFISPSANLYMFPRRDGILLGGTTERDVWTLEPDPAQETRILEEHRALFAGMKR